MIKIRPTLQVLDLHFQTDKLIEILKNGDLRILDRSRNLRICAVRCSIPNCHLLCYLCTDNLSASGTIWYKMESDLRVHLLGFIP